MAPIGRIDCPWRVYSPQPTLRTNDDQLFNNLVDLSPEAQESTKTQFFYSLAGVLLNRYPTASFSPHLLSGHFTPEQMTKGRSRQREDSGVLAIIERENMSTRYPLSVLEIRVRTRT